MDDHWESKIEALIERHLDLLDAYQGIRRDKPKGWLVLNGLAPRIDVAVSLERDGMDPMEALIRVMASEQQREEAVANERFRQASMIASPLLAGPALSRMAHPVSAPERIFLVFAPNHSAFENWYSRIGWSKIHSEGWGGVMVFVLGSNKLRGLTPSAVHIIYLSGYRLHEVWNDPATPGLVNDLVTRGATVEMEP